MSTFGSEALPGNAAGYYALGLAALIPGYLGYGRREERRNVDRELRRYIVGRMSRLKGVLAEHPDAMGDREETLDTIRRLDELARKVDEAGTGLEAFFSAGNLTETDADEIHAYDRKIIDHLDAMDAAAGGAGARTPAERGQWAVHMDRLEALVEERTRALEQVGG